ncbi:MAG TPA: hypothetical protein PLQ44_00605 [Candidatus Paceibacterota bacterium]|nr:hypothetical protein [Candidatus Paceibacterota bacterium]
MKLELTVSKLANQFYFISNLTEWHFSCRKDDNKKWLEMTGPLNEEEKDALDIFKNILQLNGFTCDTIEKSKYLGKYFLLNSEEQIWQNLKKSIKDENFQKIKWIFKIFESRFKKIWKEELNKKTIKIFEDELKKEKYDHLFNDVEKILGDNKKNKKITIHILFSPQEYETTGSGSACIGFNDITLELPKLKRNTWQLEYTIYVLAHEIAHILSDSRQTKSLIEKYCKKYTIPTKKNIKNINFPTISIINEMIIESFLPYGYLAQKYSDFQLAPHLLNNLPKGYKAIEDLKNNKIVEYYNQLNRYLIWELYHLAIIYGREKKQIDENFINQATLILKKII